jgi:hypothetical protein
MDSQVVELLGQNWLMGELLRAGLEVAIPIRDRGIDLIAYADLRDRVSAFSACPIQMKAALDSAFSIDQKYAKFPNLIIAYVWFVQDPSRTITYALTHEEAVAVAETMGYTRTNSWNAGAYVTTRPAARLVERLAPFKMDEKKWWSKVAGVAEAAAAR